MADEQMNNDGNFFISTAGVSQDRAEAVLPSVGSEDVSHLLNLAQAVHAKAAISEERDYLPNAKVDWVVHIDLRPTTILRKSAIGKVFDQDWFRRYGLPTVFGFSPDTGRWTFVNAPDVPENYSRLQIAWKLRPFDQEETNAKQPFERYLTAVEKAVAGWRATVRTEGSPKDAEMRAAALIELASSCDRSAAVVLHAPKGRSFEGKAIWDVMLCLGLRWGDMDLFHWENPGSQGDDHLFSVWTSTPPGYFFPEKIAAGQVQTADLVFGFSIPRTVQPEAIFASMMKAIHYAKQRLGGLLTDAEMNQFSEEAALSEIASVITRLKEAGFEPGSDDTLYLI